MSTVAGRPKTTFLPMPHPSGLVVDRARGVVHVASTRNPNQIFVLKPVTGRVDRADNPAGGGSGRPMVPTSSTFYPGSLYLHDLALIGGELYGNAAGHNAVVKLEPNGSFSTVWWPRCIEERGRPALERNYIQLNSIAAGRTLRESFFSASSTGLGRLRPGHLNYPVDGRGVIFAGRTREAFCRGLTRPHSARLLDGQVWVANSGYGELGVASRGKLDVLARLPGWTRGLCLIGDMALVATSRVIPKFARYAPGLNPDDSRCGVHAVSLSSGRVLASLEWPYGSQIFAIDWISDKVSVGLPFDVKTRPRSREISFFQTFLTD